MNLRDFFQRPALIHSQHGHGRADNRHVVPVLLHPGRGKRGTADRELDAEHNLQPHRPVLPCHRFHGAHRMLHGIAGGASHHPAHHLPHVR